MISDLLESTSSNLRIVHHNVQGLHSKWLEIKCWLDICGSSPVVFCFSETWCDPTSPVPSVPDFQSFYSPPLIYNSGDKCRTLPGSCLIVSDTLLPEHSQICAEI